jgi:hypothetical protein
LPPPPADALSITGSPILRALSSAASADGKPRPVGPLSPGTTGTSAAIILARARVLSPIASIALPGGPMKITPAASHARAKSAFSERKP